MIDLNTTQTYTYADYLTWTFDEYVELIKGKVFKMSPAPLRKHQKTSGFLYSHLYRFFELESCEVYHAPFDVRLYDGVKSKVKNKDITTVVQPDICVICDRSKLDDYGCMGAPDLIVEITSSGTRHKDLNTKFKLYEENLVREYWIVSPEEQTIQIFYLNENNKYISECIFTSGDTVTSKIFPKFTFEVTDAFRDD